MSDAAPEYVAARSVLLDALTALEGHLGSLILVGAQAVYHHAGEADLNVALMTTDADLAINAANLADAPEIGAVLREAGFAPGRTPVIGSPPAMSPSTSWWCHIRQERPRRAHVLPGWRRTRS
jgi:hypothetical protein